MCFDDVIDQCPVKGVEHPCLLIVSWKRELALLTSNKGIRPKVSYCYYSPFCYSVLHLNLKENETHSAHAELTHKGVN